jgi:hypothetical protein
MEKTSVKTLRNEKSVERLLVRRLQSSCRVRWIHSFREAGVLTSNKGVVITARDGREYQITIVRSL